MNKMLCKCPVCAGPLHVTEITCAGCGTQVRSEFEPCRFCRLTPDQLQFVELFLKSRGNITTVGNDIGISYPTVTKRLDSILSALGLSEESTPAPPTAPSSPASPPDNRDADRRRILEMLDRGELTAEDATRRLREL